MKYSCVPQGTCSRLIEVEVENGIITNLHVTGGCHGNLQGVAALCIGRKASEVASILGGIRCRDKATSCPDQIARALRSCVD